ncbi:MAG: hypothetical protein EOM10_08870, partial [Opitutae bacterium]|nr:hypothetical protein [Opitutae bacterium]
MIIVLAGIAQKGRAGPRWEANMETGALIGWVGGIAGGLIGLAGGIFGTWCSIRNVKSPRERAFMIKASAVCWTAILVFAVLL